MRLIKYFTLFMLMPIMVYAADHRQILHRAIDIYFALIPIQSIVAALPEQMAQQEIPVPAAHNDLQNKVGGIGQSVDNIFANYRDVDKVQLYNAAMTAKINESRSALTRLTLALKDYTLTPPLSTSLIDLRAQIDALRGL